MPKLANLLSAASLAALETAAPGVTGPVFVTAHVFEVLDPPEGMTCPLVAVYGFDDQNGAPDFRQAIARRYPGARTFYRGMYAVAVKGFDPEIPPDQIGFVANVPFRRLNVSDPNVN